MKTITLLFSCGVHHYHPNWGEKDSPYGVGNGVFQFHHPRWSFKNGDYHLLFPSLVRVLWGAKSYENNTEREFGFGILLLGFGVAYVWCQPANEKS